MRDSSYQVRAQALSRLIGNTPLLEIRFSYRGEPRRVFAKYESLNMTGSIKDRMALHILRTAHREGTLEPGDTIIEATSGNTGISFSAVGRALGHEVTIMMPDWMSRERVELIRSMGARVVPVTREQGGFLGSVSLSRELAAQTENSFLPSQFDNKANVAAHEQTTGPEIWTQLQTAGLKPDAFVAGVGTGGTVMGVGRFLRRVNPAITVHPLEPLESPTLSTGHKVGVHRIQGISDEFIPSIVELDKLDDVIGVSDGDSILMAQKLASKLGLAVGISSGANFIGALKLAERLGPDAVVVTVFADDNKKYLSTDLLRDEPAKDGYLSPDVVLGHFGVHRRVCAVCCERELCPNVGVDGCSFGDEGSSCGHAP